jgi:hypothetical protein
VLGIAKVKSFLIIPNFCGKKLLEEGESKNEPGIIKGKYIIPLNLLLLNNLYPP